MMTEARLGKKIDIWDIIGAAKAMSAGKSLDLVSEMCRYLRVYFASVRCACVAAAT